MGTADVTSPAPQVLLAHVATVLSRGALWTDTIEELLATIGTSWECSAVSLDIDPRNDGKFDDVEQLWG